MKNPFDLYTEAKAIYELNNATKAPPVSSSRLTDYDEFSVECRSSSINATETGNYGALAITCNLG